MKRILLMLILTFNILTLSAEITSTDILLSNSLTVDLFPEQNYEDCPSVLTDIESTMIIPYITLSGSLENVEAERTDDAIGIDGGTYKSTTLNLSPEFDWTEFILFDSGTVFGFDANVNSEHSLSESNDYYYSSASTNTVADYFEHSLTGGSDFYYAAPLTDFGSIGFKLGYDFTWNPASIETVTDNSSSSTLTYYNEYTSGGDTVDEYIHELNSSLGLSVDITETDLNLGLVYRGYYDDRNIKYISVDSDSNGYDETFQTMSAFYSDTAGYSYTDYSIYNSLEFASSVIMPLSSTFGFIFSGSYSIIDNLYSYYAEHLSATDTSYETSIYDAGLGSFNVMAGLDFCADDGKSGFRIGFKYSRYAQSYSQDDMNTSGTSSTYNNLNTANLTELSLGTSPSDNSLSESDDLNPYSDTVNSFCLLARYSYEPAESITLFIDGNITGFLKVETYQAFNTDTTSTWTEVVSSDGIDLNIGSFCGIGLPVGEEWLCTFGIDSNISIGNLDIASETLPYLTSTGTESDSGDELNDSMDVDFSFGLKFVYSVDN